MVEGSYADDETEELECLNIGSPYKNAISSVLVKKTAHALGHWQSITATESQEYMFHVGINYEISETTISETQQSLSLAMELGIEYGFVSGSSSIEYSYAESLTHDVQTTYGLDYSIENYTTCTAENGGAGIFQWVVTTADYSIQAYTWHTICRTGDLWNVEPDCPWSACTDAECLNCSTDWLATENDTSGSFTWGDGNTISIGGGRRLDAEPVSGVASLLN